MAQRGATEEELVTFEFEARRIQDVVDGLRAQLAQDSRQAVARAAEALEQGGALVFPALQFWPKDPDPRVRKGLVKVVAHAAQWPDPFLASFLFELLEPLLWDGDPEVRAAARRVLRERLISTCPEEALHVLARWAAEPDPRKQVFAALGLTRLPPTLARRALIPLRLLARSGESSVRRAALRAIRAWRARAPQAVEAELKRWEAVPELAPFIAHVAE